MTDRAGARNLRRAMTALLFLLLGLTFGTSPNARRSEKVHAATVLGAQLKGNGNGNGNNGNGKDKKAFTMTGTVTGLFPGASMLLPVLIDNPNNQDLEITEILVGIVSTDKPGCEPVVANLLPTDYHGTGFVVARNSTRAMDMPISMPNSVDNDCQDATFTLSFAGKGRKP